MDTPTPRRRPRPPLHHLSLRYLLIPPLLLALLTGVTLFLHSDTNTYMLYSQCHARSRLPWLSHIPLLGSPFCFLVSFFQEAIASVRAFGLMAVILGFVAGLLTVSTVESARVCNGPSVLIAYPTGLCLTQPDDRKEMTRSTLKFITVDAFFVGLTVLYWILVEAGWRVVLVMVAASVVLGPGAGICIGWIYREQTVDPDQSVTVVAVGARRDSEDAGPSEETPLLR
ncbi:hypothetical protein N0V88_000841 [Collariella sp. IMI 366227]|nr:hypothetical protein N0V88_000841 [Collariella sp. IMI 366227]